MPPALLLTQCLQNDFVKPIARYEPIPNRLHVGHAESLRLMGENPAEGPVSRVMRWAAGQPDAALRLIHIRDWHDPREKVVQDHLALFGDHCIQNTPGAAFAFPEVPTPGKRVALVDSLTLNDFQGTNLEETLAEYAGQPCRVGIMGVWTEAKVSFLAYELVTRYPSFQVAVCSALTASSSRAHHFEALDQLRRILGVQVLDSVGAFVDFLGGVDAELPLPGLREEFPAVTLEGLRLGPTDLTLVRYLFRDCRAVTLRELTGGFSGNVVAGTTSVDLHGREQVPHVVKIGPQEGMGKERTSFERIQGVLGNSAPQITDFADLGDRGAIKYRYASMGGTFSTTLQKAFQRGLPLDQVREVLDTVFGEQLGRFTRAAVVESCDLLEHYGFSDRWAPGVRRRVEAILGGPAEGDRLQVSHDIWTPDVVLFYERTLHDLPRRPADQIPMSWQHGDLNGANIILDGHRNVWLIDFFHAHRAHVLMDLVKLENDLLYIWTPVNDEADLRAAVALTDALLEVRDLAAPLPDAPEGWPDPFRRTWGVIQHLRGFYPDLVGAGRDPWQLLVAQLRYAVHTLGFDECTPPQLRWALYASGQLSARVAASLARSVRLRIDWLDLGSTAPGRLGLTILPGRQDWGRRLSEDLQAIREEGVSAALCLVPADELRAYGAGDLLRAYADLGLELHHLPIADQRACDLGSLMAAVRWMDGRLRRGQRVLVHCVGGLGRSGMAAAALLVARGAMPEDAIAEVRRARSPRAVETEVQERLVAAVPVGALRGSGG